MLKKSWMYMGVLAVMAISSPLAAYNEPYCREYTKPVTVGNRVQEGFGTACMQPDGSWQVVSQASVPGQYPVIQNPGVITTYPAASVYQTREVIVERPVIVQRPAPMFSIGWGIFDNHRHHHGHNWRGGHGYGRGYGHGHGYGRGYGRGHGHGGHRW